MEIKRLIAKYQSCCFANARRHSIDCSVDYHLNYYAVIRVNPISVDNGLKTRGLGLRQKKRYWLGELFVFSPARMGNAQFSNLIV